MRYLFLLTIVMFFGVEMTAAPVLSYFNGNYSSTDCQVQMPDVDDAHMPVTIEVTGVDGASTAVFRLRGIAMGGENLGELVLTLGLSDKGDEGYMISEAVGLDGPTLADGRTSKISVASSEMIIDGEKCRLGLQLSIELYKDGEPAGIVTVTTGDAERSGVLTKIRQVSGLTVFPGTATSVIKVSDSGEYVIYSANGATVKAGITFDGNISVSSFPVGVYVVSINGQSARFLKK